MKFLCVSAITVLTLNAFAQDLYCESLSPVSPKVQSFTIAQIDQHENKGSYLVGLDGYQYDASSIEDNLITLELNNGCDNSFSFVFNKNDFSLVLDGQKKSLEGHFSFGWAAEGRMYETNISCSLKKAEE